MNSKSSLLLADKVIIVLVLLAYLFFQFPFLQTDLWNDEIYTLKHFTFVPFLRMVTDYHVPNNHIFFNVINHFYLSLIGEQNVYTLMDHPWVLRIFTLLYAFGTIFFTYRCAQRFMGKTEALLSIIVLCSTIPFYNFAVEIRGYCLTMFLLSATTYFLFAFVETKRQKFLLMMTIASASAVYTIPLCLYSMAGILVFSGCMLIGTVINNSFRIRIQEVDQHWKKYLFVIVGIMAGVLLAILCYVNIFADVFYNEYVIPDRAFTVARWFTGTKKVFAAFLSHRDLLIPLILAGITGNIYQLFILKNKRSMAFVFFLLIMLLFPFVISLLRKDAPPDRTFVNLIPFFSMLMAWMIHGVFSFVNNIWGEFFLKGSIAVYCFVILTIQTKVVDDYLMNDIQTSHRSHDIYYNYYLHHFHPLIVVKKFKETVYNDSSFVVIRDAEPHDLPEYLEKFSIPIHDITMMDSALITGKKVFLFSRYPNEILNETFQKQHTCSATKISEGISYHNLFELKYPKPD